MTKVKTHGFSLIEILVVIGVFAVLSLLSTLAITFSLRGTRKSDSQSNLRANVDAAIQIMTRQLKNAESVSSCTGVASTTIDFVDQLGNANSFSCEDIGGAEGGYVASSSANIKLTSDDVNITTCSFVCTPGAAGRPDAITVLISAVDENNTGLEGANITLETQINLRNY